MIVCVGEESLNDSVSIDIGVEGLETRHCNNTT